jgi:hypothetical protein
LGVHQRHLTTDCDPADWQALSSLDARKLDKLLDEDERVPESWRCELRAMRDRMLKSEMEAAYKLRGVPAFCRLIVSDLLLHAAL